jgi:hypothetical protein
MTAMGDDPGLLARMYAAFDGREDVAVSHLALFPMPNVEDIRAHLLAQDVLWVVEVRWRTCWHCGGCTVSIL